MDAQMVGDERADEVVTVVVAHALAVGQLLAGGETKTVINNVTINGLLPGPFDTDRLRGTAKGEAEKRGVDVEQILKERAKLNPAGRFGTPEEFGLACAFLCADKAGFITGQTIPLDGRAFPGTL
jgi:3-oxoacyl-[acyl-carrier protein] reductase